MEWGPEIVVNGVKPDWLNGRQACVMKTSAWCTWQDETPLQPAEKWAWSHSGGLPCITAIKLPADHFAYVAIAKGYTPWGGGNEAPADWDSGPVLFRDGYEWPHELAWWSHDSGREGGPESGSDVIGYHPKPIAQPSPADTVTIARMTEAEASAFGRHRGYGDINSGDPSDCHYYGAMRDLGLIRPATKAEQIATKTGLSVKDVEAVLAAMEEVE